MRTSVHPPNRRVSVEPPPPEEAPASVRPKAAEKKKKAKLSPAEKAERKARRQALVSRWLRRLSLLTGAIVVVGASVLVAWGLRTYLRSSPRFAIRTIAVDGNQRRTPHQLVKRAGLAAGQNIFALDEQRAASAILADPWIAEAKVTRDLPNSVHIAVVEHEARALATLKGQLYLVDSQGVLFKKRTEGDPSDLFVITGVQPEALAKDREAVTQQIKKALELVAELERSRVPKRYPLQEVRIEPDGALALVVGSDAISLTFGPPPYRLKIAKLERILGELRHRKVVPTAVFLDNQAHPERVVVRVR